MLSWLPGTPVGTRTSGGEDPASALCKPSEWEEIWSWGLGRVKASGGGPGLPGWGEVPREPGPPGRGGFQPGLALEPAASTTCDLQLLGPSGLPGLRPRGETALKKALSLGGVTVLLSLSPRNPGRPPSAAAHPPSSPSEAASAGVLRGHGLLSSLFSWEEKRRGRGLIPEQGKLRGHAGSGSVPRCRRVPRTAPQ